MNVRIYVSKDGNGEYTKVADALNNAKDGDTIVIKSGTYEERLYIDTPNLTMIGEGDVILTYFTAAEQKVEGSEEYMNYLIEKSKGGYECEITSETEVYNTFTSSAVTILEAADNFRAENITFENSWNRADESRKVTQALAVCCGANASFENCTFLGKQDTLYVRGKVKQHFYKCFIEGTVDFIFGDATALFEDCRINCVRDKSYISAASTDKDTEFGFVFLNCDITAEGMENIYLGRPWRAEYPNVKSHTAFINCIYDFDGNSEGWLRWHAPEGRERERIRYEEFGNTRRNGEPVDVSGRIEWSYQLDAEAAKKYTRENILK